VASAGLASAGAAFLTSKFGVAGTLIGAAITTMIITGGSAILKAYLESVTGSVRQMPGRVRERRKAARYGEPASPPGRPDLRDNFAGRMRAALSWFSNLPPLARRSILVKGLLAALAAFVIGMGIVYATERAIDNNLSCGLWANCAEGRSPGIHLGGGGDGAGAAPTISFSRGQTNVASDRGGGILERRDSVRQDSGYQPPAQRRAPSGAAPADPNVRPVEPQGPAETPGGEAPTPGQQPPADGAVPDEGAAPGGVPALPAE
jgi:hypothetical protein